jgi:hypothetical protein
MKKILWLILIAVGVIGAVYYFLTRKSAAAAATVATTGTQTGFAAFFPGWTGFNQASLTAAKANVTGYQSLLTSVSNAFGINDGGTNPGVSTGGSVAGGIASSGSGAAPPAPSNSTANSIFAGVANPPASALYDTTTGLNGTGDFSLDDASLSFS